MTKCEKDKRMSNVAGKGEEHSTIWGMFMGVTMNAATFMGKNFQDNQNSIKNTTDLTLRKCWTSLPNKCENKMRSSNVETIPLGKTLMGVSVINGDETVIDLQRAKAHVFRSLCCVLEGSINIRSPTKLGKTG